ncbi:MAG: protein kinase domain-containing protein [Acidimicrobiales bacterium]
MAEPAGPIAAGAELGPYRLVEPIGSGAFATVWRARDRRLDAAVAIKILAENRVFDPDVRERFLGEAQLLRRIDSGHVIRILDVGETPGLQPFLVLEYADGGEWGDRVEQARSRGVAVTRAELIVLARSLADGLAAVHAQDLVHRDVSPGTILIKATTATGARPADGVLGPDERLCLSDLGYAKDLGASSGLTVGGGTPRFSAPEQRRDITTVDVRADVYAAGAVMAWTVIGDRLPADLGPDPVGALVGLGLDPVVAAAIGPGLATDPDDRPADALSWGRGVVTALGSPGGAATTGPGPARSPTHRPDGPAPDELAATAVLGEAGAGTPPTGPGRPSPAGASADTTVVAEPAATRIAEPATELMTAPAGAGSGPAATGPAPPPADPAPMGHRARWWIAPLIAVAAVVGFGAGALRPGRTPVADPVTTVLDDGVTRVSDERGTVAAALFVPPDPVIGQTITVRAGATGVETLVWVLPDGSVVAGVDQVELTPRQAGDVIRLVAVGPETSVVISHPLEARAFG